MVSNCNNKRIADNKRIGERIEDRKLVYTLLIQLTLDNQVLPNFPQISQYVRDRPIKCTVFTILTP